jgi:hypothetical protein
VKAEWKEIRVEVGSSFKNSRKCDNSSD